MIYIPKNYSLNHTYFIEKNAIINVIDRIIIENKELIKVQSYNINISPNKRIFKINISLFIKKEQDFGIIKYFSKLIDNKFKNLFNIKPDNVLIDIKGVF